MQTTALGIRTKYHGPTNYRGARIIAFMPAAHDRKRVTLPWDHALGSFENHRAAALAFAKLHNIQATFVACDLEDSYIFTALENGLGVSI